MSSGTPQIFAMFTAGTSFVIDFATALFENLVREPHTRHEDISYSIVFLARLIAAVVFVSVVKIPSSLAVLIFLSPKLSDFFVRMYRNPGTIYTPTDMAHRLRCVLAYFIIGIVYWEPKNTIMKYAPIDILLRPVLYAIYLFLAFPAYAYYVITIAIGCFFLCCRNEGKLFKIFMYFGAGLSIALIFIGGSLSGCLLSIWMQFYPFLGSGVFLEATYNSSYKENVDGYWKTGIAYLIKIAFDEIDRFGPLIIKQLYPDVDPLPKHLTAVGHWSPNGEQCLDIEFRRSLAGIRVQREKGTHNLKLIESKSNFPFSWWSSEILPVSSHPDDLDGEFRLSLPNSDLDWSLEAHQYRAGALPAVQWGGKKIYQIILSYDIIWAYKSIKLYWIWNFLINYRTGGHHLNPNSNLQCDCINTSQRAQFLVIVKNQITRSSESQNMYTIVVIDDHQGQLSGRENYDREPNIPVEHKVEGEQESDDEQQQEEEGDDEKKNEDDNEHQQQEEEVDDENEYEDDNENGQLIPLHKS
ncbi:hypothetical protein HK098_001486 [Nowakowskiella sp. JEL0407]|nr:hypothetical protein HK098_001486 [Nowakowskiella sp. JEL0407]